MTDTADDELARRLDQLFNDLDPVPELVLASARAAFTLRQLDAELAELVRDSWEQQAGLIAVRGAGDVRLISFETGTVSVELQVTDRGPFRDLVAQVAGAEVGQAAVETPAGRHAAVVEDSVVTADGVPAGLMRVHLITSAGAALVTAWVRA